MWLVHRTVSNAPMLRLAPPACSTTLWSLEVARRLSLVVWQAATSASAPTLTNASSHLQATTWTLRIR